MLRNDANTFLAVVGPIVGGFAAQNPRLGWHFNFWITFIFSVLTLVVGYFIGPETVGTLPLTASTPDYYYYSLSYSMHLFCFAGEHKNFRRHPTAPFTTSQNTIITSPGPSFRSCAPISVGHSVSSSMNRWPLLTAPPVLMPAF